MSKPDDLGAGFSSITTRAELHMLEAQRTVPALTPKLDMDGPIGHAVRAQEPDRKEARITALRDRLEEKGQGVLFDQTFASLKGRARADFGR